MGTQAIIWTIVGSLVAIAFITVAAWMWLLDRDDFDQPAAAPGMTDDERRAAPLGIGLSSGNMFPGA